MDIRRDTFRSQTPSRQCSATKPSPTATALKHVEEAHGPALNAFVKTLLDAATDLTVLTQTHRPFSKRTLRTSGMHDDMIRIGCTQILSVWCANSSRVEGGRPRHY